MATAPDRSAGGPHAHGSGRAHGRIRQRDGALVGCAREGLGRADRLRVAAERAGVNSNVLADHEALDPLSGTSVLNGIPVTVSAG